jgi:hypothetical protein
MATLLMMVSPLSAVPKAKKVPRDLKPIVMKLKWGAVRYSVDGGKMNSFKTLGPYIDRLGDTEASALIAKARKRDRVSNVFGLLSAAGIVWGACALWIGEDKEWNDPEVEWPFIAGLSFGAVSGAVRASSESCRFDAVQRFNAVVRGEQKLSLDLRMKGSLALAGASYRF